MFPSLNALIDSAPDLPELAAPGESSPVSPEIPQLPDTIAERTGFPARYRAGWERPTDALWIERHAKLVAAIKSGGIIGMIGPRGTGKTRHAAEAMRDCARVFGRYATAMGLFLRIRATFDKRKAIESESDIVAEMSRSPLLVLDEIQERGETAWEDRILTHLLDARYGAMLPTIVLGNVGLAALQQQLGDSIVSRLTETGGVMEINGPSFRAKP